MKHIRIKPGFSYDEIIISNTILDPYKCNCLHNAIILAADHEITLMNLYNSYKTCCWFCNVQKASNLIFNAEFSDIVCVLFCDMAIHFGTYCNFCLKLIFDHKSLTYKNKKNGKIKC